MSCEYISKQNKPCPHIKLEGTDYCHNESHHENKIIFSNILEKIKRDFTKSRIPLSKFKYHNVTPDGACLYRCMVNGLFTYSGNSLEKMCQLFINNEYFPTDIDKTSFIKEYLELSDNFEHENTYLPEEMETELAEILQKIVVLYVRKNKDNLILEKYPKYIEIIPDYSITNIIEDTHEITIDEYLKNYEKFAGDDDFEYIEKTIKPKNKRRKEYTKKVKKDIDDRWGGIPEIIVTSFIFNIGINIYIPQIFDERYAKTKTIKSLNSKNEIFLYLIDSIDTINPNKINLLLGQIKRSPHYIYLN